MAQTLPALASVEALSDWIGEPIPADSADWKRARGVLRMASELVREETKRQWLDPENLASLQPRLPDPVELVTLQAAARSYLNPEHLEQERGDDWYGSRKVQESGVYLTQSEKSLLQPFAGARHGGLGVVSTTRADTPRYFEDGEERILPPYY